MKYIKSKKLKRLDIHFKGFGGLKAQHIVEIEDQQFFFDVILAELRN